MTVYLNKSRIVTNAIKWRIDYDYLSRLSPEERLWLDRFTVEYYLRGELKTPNSLHNNSQTALLYKDDNAARCDVVTLPASTVIKANPKNKPRYSPDDWLFHPDQETDEGEELECNPS